MKVGSLTASKDAEGNLTLFPEFLAQEAIYRADVLRDLMHEITAAYQEAVRDMRKDWEEAKKAIQA